MHVGLQMSGRVSAQWREFREMCYGKKKHLTVWSQGRLHKGLTFQEFLTIKDLGTGGVGRNRVGIGSSLTILLWFKPTNFVHVFAT